MSLVLLVALAGMGGAAFIAEATRGYASVINQAGALRMQSYRLSTLALARSQMNREQYQREMEGAITSFEQSLNNLILPPAVFPGAGSAHAKTRQVIALRWQQEIKPRLMGLSEQTTPAALGVLLERTHAYVAQIDVLVKQIELDVEKRIGFLHWMIVATLLLTLGIVLLIMYFLHRAVLMPLHDLLRLTMQIGRGNLDARTQRVGEDEIGRLGQAFNQMAEELAALYQNLETRVADKTADLERSNRSLELLYHSIARLYNGPVAADTYRLLLREIEEVLDLGAGSACLVEGAAQGNISVLASTLNSAQGDIAFCSLSSCAECMAEEGLHLRELGGRKVLSIPLRDAERMHGVMQLLIPPGQEIAPWKMRLLEALSRHIGTAIGTARRTEHQRMLSLLEERSVIARELHDSLAQSLSYMKIQVSRLASLISKDKPPSDASHILDELREGLNGAYRQLRELLTTFRLRIEGQSLSSVLENTVQEFSSRNSLKISLETHLTNCPLSANEEIHILQIVREALSNVVHHAKASQAQVVLSAGADGVVSVSIVDDGVGIAHLTTQRHHYGMAIMEERARSLGGRLAVMARPEGGTHIEICFTPLSQSSPEKFRQQA